MQDCGKCRNFIKWKKDRFGGGLCEFFDARTKSDHGHKCPSFQYIKLHKNILHSNADMKEELHAS